MRVNLYTTLRQAAGQKTVELSLPDGATIALAIRAIIAAHPALKAPLLAEGDRIQGHIRIFVNGRVVVDVDQALEMHLGADDTLDVFPAIAGGDAPARELGISRPTSPRPG